MLYPQSSCRLGTPKRGRGKEIKSKLILKDSEEGWPRRRFRAALPWGAAYAVSELKQPLFCQVWLPVTRMWAGRGCQLLQMWVEGHGVTRSNQMRKCMQKQWETAKPQTDGVLALSAWSLAWENTVNSCCELYGMCKGFFFFFFCQS